MKKRIIIYISILGFLAALMLPNFKEIENIKYVNGGTQQVKNQLEEDEAINLFKHVQVD